MNPIDLFISVPFEAYQSQKLISIYPKATLEHIAGDKKVCTSCMPNSNKNIKYPLAEEIQIKW